MIDVAVRLRVAGHRTIGSGKIRLLELIEEHGSIAAAGRAMEMAYSHAWALVNSLNETFVELVVERRPGGTDGGGARLTPFGAELVRRYRSIERRTREVSSEDLAALRAAIASDVPAMRPGPSRRGPS